MTDLRTRQREVAQASMLDACAALISERRHLNFSMQEVADAAGVSLRTLYNHFPTREDLLDGLSTATDTDVSAQRTVDAASIRTLDDLQEAISTNLAAFEAGGARSEATAQLPLADVGRNTTRTQRTGQIVEAITDIIGIDNDETRAIAAALRHLISHRSWFWLTREYGLDTEQTADIVAWLTRLAIDAASRGDLPRQGEPT